MFRYEAVDRDGMRSGSKDVTMGVLDDFLVDPVDFDAG